MRPFGAAESSPMKWSPAPPGICVVKSSVRSGLSEYRYICAYGPRMSEMSTSSRLCALSNAGAGYEPPARNWPPEMLKQPGGNRHTGFVSVANWTGVLHVVPPSVDFDAYRTVRPLP